MLAPNDGIPAPNLAGGAFEPGGRAPNLAGRASEVAGRASEVAGRAPNLGLEGDRVPSVGSNERNREEPATKRSCSRDGAGRPAGLPAHSLTLPELLGM